MALACSRAGGGALIGPNQGNLLGSPQGGNGARDGAVGSAEPAREGPGAAGGGNGSGSGEDDEAEDDFDRYLRSAHKRWTSAPLPWLIWDWMLYLSSFAI